MLRSTSFVATSREAIKQNRWLCLMAWRSPTATLINRRLTPPGYDFFGPSAVAKAMAGQVGPLKNAACATVEQVVSLHVDPAFAGMTKVEQVEIVIMDSDLSPVFVKTTTRRAGMTSLD